MRMWLCKTKIMCRQHLCGEHLETHMFLQVVLGNKSVKGYLKNNLLEPKKLKERHDELEAEMIKRRYNPKSPISETNFNEFIKNLGETSNIVIDKDKSLKELLKRCPECKQRYKALEESYL